MDNYYNNFLDKYPDLQIHLSIISEQQKELQKSFDLEDWKQRILEYFQYIDLNEETETQLINLNEELNQAIDLIHIFKYRLGISNG